MSLLDMNIFGFVASYFNQVSFYIFLRGNQLGHIRMTTSKKYSKYQEYIIRDSFLSLKAININYINNLQ